MMNVRWEMLLRIYAQIIPDNESEIVNKLLLHFQRLIVKKIKLTKIIRSNVFAKTKLICKEY